MTSTRIAVALVVALTGSAWSMDVQKGEIPGVTNFTRVDATIGCAGKTPAAAMPEIKKLGFVSVVNLRAATEQGADVEEGRAAAVAAGLKYVHLPFDGQNPDPKVVESFLAAVKDPANQPVYIHCGSANRVGGVWMIKRVLQDGWDLEKARTEAKAIGLTNPKLEAFAVEYIQSQRKP
jgi:uncharacterized protein (TIGR01244 family)